MHHDHPIKHLIISLNIVKSLATVRLFLYGSKSAINASTITSLEIASIAGKRHDNVIAAIKKMEPAWEKVNGLKFKAVDYVDSKGEKRPCYELSKTESLYIATKFNDEARAKLILRWEQLERENLG